ncbi:MAG TPA: cytochrome b N-terminal domain-containing protein [Vicinamibacterales bacterium]|nr:cytochrome b N-terminal domain-containing protein [Vicinamibacterales bacterium]
MATRGKGVLNWLDSRTGYRNGLKHLLDEPIQSGTGWWFTLGSILMALLGIQFITGAVLTMYYVPSPAYAYDSVKYISTGLTFGHVLRDLHFFGASFIVIAAVAHLLRVLFFGSYKKPREVTWLTGVCLLLVILGFALTGYLLPWDQRAYWATVVSTNIAKTAPLLGPYVSALMKGGQDVGALTLNRWFAVHVIILPALLVVLAVTHLYLMRRHGISGPVRPRHGKSHPFYPDHAIKDTLVVALVFALLVTFAVYGHAPLAAKADPTDASYIPRPEWYFMSLFQLLHYFKGGLEPVATIGIPTLLVAVLFLLPWLDRKQDRDPRKRPVVTTVTVLVLGGIVTLTAIGLHETPPEPNPDIWGPASVAGEAIAQSTQCTRCHTDGGVAAVLGSQEIRQGDGWIEGHLSDPEMIAPGLRPKPQDALDVVQTRAVIAYVKKLQGGVPPPSMPADVRAAYVVIGSNCLGCHSIKGEGTRSGDAPDLTHEGRTRKADWLDQWITDPTMIDASSTMPAFGDKLNAQQIQTVANYLSSLK